MLEELLQIDRYDLVFGISAVLFNLLVAALFVAQKRKWSAGVQRLGVLIMLLSIPFTVVFVVYLGRPQPAWVPVFFGLILLYFAVEFLLDYILKIDFRSRWSTHIPYIILEYLALFGMIGIAFQINRAWGTIVSIAFWLLLGGLVYLYWGRKKTKLER